MNRLRPSALRCLLYTGWCLVVILSATDASEAGRRGKEPRKKDTARLKLAQTYYLNSRLPEALATVEEVLKDRPKYLEAHQLRGQILFGMDAVEEALAEFNRTLKIDDAYTEARNWRAFALVQLGRYDEAMTEYDRALEDLTYQTPEKIHTNRAMLLRLMDRHEEAIAGFEEAVRINPSYTRGFYELGITHGRMGNKARAIEYFEIVIKMSPDAPEAGLARDQIERIQSPS